MVFYMSDNVKGSTIATGATAASTALAVDAIGYRLFNLFED